MTRRARLPRLPLALLYRHQKKAPRYTRGWETRKDATRYRRNGGFLFLEQRPLTHKIPDIEEGTPAHDKQNKVIHVLPAIAERRQSNTPPRLAGDTYLAIRRKRKFVFRDVGQRGHRRHPSNQRRDRYKDAGWHLPRHHGSGQHRPNSTR